MTNCVALLGLKHFFPYWERPYISLKLWVLANYYLTEKLLLQLWEKCWWVVEERLQDRAYAMYTSIADIRCYGVKKLHRLMNVDNIKHLWKFINSFFLCLTHTHTHTHTYTHKDTHTFCTGCCKTKVVCQNQKIIFWRFTITVPMLLQ